MTNRNAKWPAGRIDDIVDRYQRPLLAYAGRMLSGDWQGAQDAVQETFLRLCRQDPTSVDHRVAAWLFSVCRTRVIDMQRTQRATPIDASQMTLPDPSPDPATTIQDDEERTKLNGLMNRLTPRQQEVLRLRMTGGLSYREIADVTGMTVSNVGVHLHEAVKALRSQLAT